MGKYFNYLYLQLNKLKYMYNRFVQLLVLFGHNFNNSNSILCIKIQPGVILQEHFLLFL